MAAILDSSAIVAYLKNEAGADEVARYLDTGSIVAVNAAEVIAVLIRNGMLGGEAREALLALGIPIIPLDAALALRAGEIFAGTRQFGLSMGDASCLALAETTRSEAITADRTWASTGLGIPVRLIR